ncbi:MAG: hypothetical protein ABL901_09450 [Hyphomicrobiaceae bacterium]
MIVLDTNVLSEEMKPAPYALVHQWFLAQDARELFTTTATRKLITSGTWWRRNPQGHGAAGQKLDREENDGPGCDKHIAVHLDRGKGGRPKRAFIRPRILDRATVLGGVKARPGNTEQVSWYACRPTLTPPARVGVLILWLGRKKACGAVEPKK